MDVLYSCVIPRVALWSHSAAEPLLLRLAVAGILMGGQRFLFWAPLYVMAGVSRLAFFDRCRVCFALLAGVEAACTRSGSEGLGVRAGWHCSVGFRSSCRETWLNSHTRQDYSVSE